MIQFLTELVKFFLDIWKKILDSYKNQAKVVQKYRMHNMA